MGRFIVSIVVLANTAFASPVLIHDGFLTGQAYLESSDEHKRAYVMGLVDALFLAPLIGGSESRTEALGKCIQGTTDMQIASMLSKHLRENPEIWHRSAHTAMYRVMLKFCPGFGAAEFAD